MIEHKEHFHGSDLEKIEAIYGIKKEDITSFSANVNPLGISYRLREGLMEHIDAITTYPDREYTSLRKCIAEYTGTDYRNILVGNGSTELISLVIQLKHPKKALIVGPTYSEYEHELSLEGGRSHYFRLKESDDFQLNIDELKQALDRDIDLLAVVQIQAVGKDDVGDDAALVQDRQRVNAMLLQNAAGLAALGHRDAQRMIVGRMVHGLVRCAAAQEKLADVTVGDDGLQMSLRCNEQDALAGLVQLAQRFQHRGGGRNKKLFYFYQGWSPFDVY